MEIETLGMKLLQSSKLYTALKKFPIKDFFSNYINARWDTSTSSQVGKCNGVMLEIFMNHKFQWLQEGLTYEPLICNTVT